MKISDKTRPAKAGKQLGEAIIEFTHLLYLNDNALQFLKSLVKTLGKELSRRIKVKRSRKP